MWTFMQLIFFSQSSIIMINQLLMRKGGEIFLKKEWIFFIKKKIEVICNLN